MNDKNLIFLISQPRSGSSLLQQLLISNPYITSLPEPWFMLPLIYTYKFPGVESDYNSSYANICLNNYLEHFNHGKELYKNYLKEFALKIYNVAFEKLNCKKYFLDKTTRYYHIIHELSDIFSGAKFIILVRNPLSVFASILDYNFKGNFWELLKNDDYICDLMIAPKKIIAAKESKSKRFVFIKYEDLVKNPKFELQNIFDFLSLDLSSLITNYSINDMFKSTTSIDTKSVHKHNEPVPLYLEAWKESIDSSFKKKLALEYLEKLGRDTIKKLGYSYSKTIDSIQNHVVKPSKISIPFDLNKIHKNDFGKKALAVHLKEG